MSAALAGTPRSFASRSAGLLLSFVLTLALLSSDACGAEDPIADGRARLDDLSELMRMKDAPDHVVVAAIEDVRRAYTAVSDVGPPPATPMSPEAKVLVHQVESALLHIVGAPRRNADAAEDDRHQVRVAAVRALASTRREVAGALREVLEESIYASRDFDPFPSFHDEAFATLLHLDPAGSWQWILDEGVNCEKDDASIARNLAALDALRLHEPRPDARMRIAGVRRLVAIFQAPDAFWNDWYDEVAGVRKVKDKMGKWWYGQFWVDMRDPVLETLRRFGTDPITGAPPLDVDDGTEMFLVRRWITWQAKNRPLPASPWVDPDPDASPRGFPARPKISPLEAMFGVPWERWWRENRRLERPESITSAGVPFHREAYRVKELPRLLAPFLEDPLAEIRAVAAIQFARTGTADAGPRLASLLGPDIPPVVREGAALGLFVLGDAAQRDLLRMRSVDPKEAPRVRAATILALGRIGDRAFLREQLLERGTGVPDDARAAAVAALGLVGDRIDGPLLAAMLLDPATPDSVRGTIGPALLRIGDPAATHSLRSVLVRGGDGAPAGTAQTAVAIAWASTVAPDDMRAWTTLHRWFERYDDRFGGARNAAVVGLGAEQHPLVLRFLKQKYEEVRRDHRRSAEVGFHLLALGLQREDEATAILRESLEDLKHERDQGACAIALALAGDKASAPAILELFRRSRRYAVAPSTLALGMLRHVEAVEPIRDLLDRLRDPVVLENGALALALLLGPEAFGDLRGLWERCRDPELRDGLAEAFRIAGAPASVEWLCARAADATLPVQERCGALSALGRMAHDAEGSKLDRLSRDHNSYAGAASLDGFVRHRDLAPVRTTER